MAKYIVHVNQHMIKHNRKTGDNKPVITIKHKGKTFYAWDVKFTGPSELISRMCNPLSCGATVWMQTESPIIMINEYGDEFDGLSFKELHSITL